MHKKKIIIILILLFLVLIAIKYTIKNNFNNEYFTDNYHYIECECSKQKKIKIVYFAYLKPNCWKNIVFSQMEHLLKTDILSKAELHVVLSGATKDIYDAETKIKLIFKQFISLIHFTYSYENTFEYPGIKLLYDEAIKYPEKIFLYFHSKGMVYHSNNNERIPGEIVLFKSIIENWKEIIHIFDTQDNINKVCYGCAKNGVCWFNFFWVRGTCLNTCTIPLIDKKNRYYYEGYMSTCGLKSYKDCYNMKKDQLYYSSYDIVKVYDADIEKLLNLTN
jgi:hypothetical protein